MKDYFDLETNEIDTEEEYYRHEFDDNTFLNKRIPFFKKHLNDYKHYPKSSGCNFKYKKIYKNQFDEVYSKYRFNEIEGQNNDFEKSVNIMNWIGRHSYYYGYSKLSSRTPVEIIEKYFDKGFKGAINCYMKSIVLADILCSSGIYAIPVTITVNVVDKSVEDYVGNGQVHVVVHAYIKELSKWVMFDPSYNAYVVDKRNNVMNLIDLKDAYNNREEIIIGQYNFNGNPDRYKDQYIENLTMQNFRIELKQDNIYYHLIPEGLDFTDYVMHIHRNGDDKHKENIRNIVSKYQYISVDEFLSVPDLIQF